jgi:hypothetical protein
VDGWVAAAAPSDDRGGQDAGAVELWRLAY